MHLVCWIKKCDSVLQLTLVLDFLFDEIPV